MRTPLHHPFLKPPLNPSNRRRGKKKQRKEESTTGGGVTGDEAVQLPAEMIGLECHRVSLGNESLNHGLDYLKKESN
jgi:hypothetical protein